MNSLLEQKPLPLHSTKILLKESHNIVVEEERGFSTTRQTLPLDIDPEPAKVQAIRLQWAIVSVITVFVLIQSFQTEGFNPVVFTTSLILGVVTYATMTKAVADYRNHFVSTEPQTNGYLFAIRANTPSNEHATIMTRLEKKLKSAGVVKPMSDDIEPLARAGARDSAPCLLACSGPARHASALE